MVLHVGGSGELVKSGQYNLFHQLMTGGHKSELFGTNAISPEVFFVFNTFQIGGTEQHLLSLTGPLVRRGWRVSIYALSGSGQLRAAFEDVGATVIPPLAADDGGRISLSRRLLNRVHASLHLYRVLRKRRPKIVHFFLPEAYLVGAPAAILARVPIRIRSRRSLNSYRFAHPIAWRLEKLLHRSMSAVLGNSRSVVAQLHDQEGVPVGRLGLIYNGVDYRCFEDTIPAAEAKRALGLAPTTLSLIIVANLIAYKGHADLLQALTLVKPRLVANWRLFVVGRDDGIGKELRAQTEASGLENNVVFLGPRKDIPALLAACDIGLLCSHEEGFSNTVLEGMAAGLPMIVTDVGGNPEAVLNGKTGLVVPPRDPQQLGDAIIQLANDPVLRAKLGEEARQRIAKNFTLEQCVERYDSLYRALVQGKLMKDLPEIGAGAQ